MENNESNQAVKPAQDLVDKVKATKALATAHSLLGIGMFQIRNQEAVNQSIEFLANLHKQVLAECLSHPDSDLIEDLKEYKADLNRQAELQKLMAEQAKEQSNG